jgi:hypothetical protein
MSKNGTRLDSFMELLAGAVTMLVLLTILVPLFFYANVAPEEFEP